MLGPGNHGTTFGGNPLAMRAGVETLRIMEEDGLLDNAADGRRARCKAALERELAGVAGVVEMRGQGLMIGIELDRPCGALLGRAAEAGLMISVTADTRDPPAAAADPERRRGATRSSRILAPLIKEFLAEPARA